MPYEYAMQDEDYSDLSSGRVLYSLPGLPAFPVRLASEIFLRAAAALRAAPNEKLTLYDPTCGGAYHLAALGLLHGERIGAILASDVNPRAVELARRNLALLSSDGLRRREEEIHAMLDQFGKPSHAAALRSAAALRERLSSHPPVRARVFQANALDPAAVKTALGGETIRLVICDVPYGQLSEWHMPEESTNSEYSPAWRLLDALLPALAGEAIVAIAADKSQKIAHEAYRRVNRFQIGKRRISFLSPR